MNNYDEKCLSGTYLIIILFKGSSLSLKNVVKHILLLLFSLRRLTSLERVEFLTDTSIVMRSKRKEANLFILLESFRLKVRRNYRRENAWSPGLVLNLLVQRMQQLIILSKLEIACSSINIVRAISWEVVVKVAREILRPHHWEHLIVNHILLMILL